MSVAGLARLTVRGSLLSHATSPHQPWSQQRFRPTHSSSPQGPADALPVGSGLTRAVPPSVSQQ